MLDGNVRQLGDVRRREQFHRRPATGVILEIDKGDLLPVAVFHDKTGAQFLNGPGRRGSGERDKFGGADGGADECEIPWIEEQHDQS